MKRYLLFMGVEFYPDGGWDDFIGAYDSIEDARKARMDERTREGFTLWWHIVDLESLRIVEHGDE